MQTQEVINVHCHLLNFGFVPDSFFRTRAPVREWILRRKLIGWLARCFTFLWPGKKYDKLHEGLALMRKDIRDVARELVGEMREANIVLATPLMMDLGLSFFNEKPEIPYRYQVKLISDIAAGYPGTIMPFVMSDPRRRSASQLVKTALEEMGFLGVKMYPPLGYHPDPSSFFNDAETNHELEEIYGYCEANSIPITTHCSRQSAYTAYSSDLMHCKELIQEFCQPSSWAGVLEKHPGLYLNFAHFGGNREFMDIDNAESWSNTIQQLMKEYENVYADLSYHNMALMKKTAADYFELLNRLLQDSHIENRIIFGTDWLMTRHTWNEKEYVDAFRRLAPAILQRIAFENPLKFLFPGKKLPPRIKHFYESRNISKAQFPGWMKNNLAI